MSNAERLEELIEQAERAHNLPVLRVQPTKTLLKAIDSEIVEPLEKRIVDGMKHDVIGVSRKGKKH